MKQNEMFFWNSLGFSMIQWMLTIWSLVPLPLWNPAYASGNSWFMYCWSLAWRIWSITLLAHEVCTIVWHSEHSLALPFFGIRMKTDLFQVCGHCWVFQIVWHIECSTLTASSLAGVTFDSKFVFAPSTILLGLLLAPGHGVSFFKWDPTFSCLWLLSIFGVLAGEDDCMSLYSAILMSKPLLCHRK